MIQRIFALTGYFWRRLLFSLGGVFLLIAAVAFWGVFFNPRQGRVPEYGYFVLLVGAFGSAIAILATLIVCNKTASPESAPLFVRFASRIEALVAIIIVVASFTFVVQLFLSIIILLQPGGVALSSRFWDIPPLWISADLFLIVLTLHATDLVANGSSRIALFGLLTLLLFSQSVDTRGIAVASNWLNNWAMNASRWGWEAVATALRAWSGQLAQNGLIWIDKSFGLVFWPFYALIDGVEQSHFDNAQALAPAIFLLYATILFLLASDLFANKDLHFAD